jgi:hypothetical protein
LGDALRVVAGESDVAQLEHRQILGGVGK